MLNKTEPLRFNPYDTVHMISYKEEGEEGDRDASSVTFSANVFLPSTYCDFFLLVLVHYSYTIIVYGQNTWTRIAINDYVHCRLICVLFLRLIVN